MSRPATRRPTPTPDLAGLLSRRPAPERQARREDAHTDDDPRPLPAVSPESDLASVDDLESQSPTEEATADASGNDSNAPRTRTYLRSITVYLPRELSERLLSAAEHAGSTRTALLLTAVNATHSSVVAAVQSRSRANAEQRCAGGLFDIPQAQRGVASVSVQSTIRVTDAQLEALNHLARQAGVSRSRVLAEALELYLSASNPVGGSKA